MNAVHVWGTLAVIGVLLGFSGAPRPATDGPVGAMARLGVRSPRDLELVVDLEAAILARAELPAPIADADREHDGAPGWRTARALEDRLDRATREIRGRFTGRWREAQAWEVTVGGRRVAIGTPGYWPETTGAPVLGRFPDGGTHFARRPALADSVFFHLDAPLAEGDAVRVRGPGGVEAELRFDSTGTVNAALHVDTVGYSTRPHARRRAYLGSWLGTAGPMDVGFLAGRPFALHRVRGSGPDGGPLFDPVAAFTGTLRERSRPGDQIVRRTGELTDGEHVLELDFDAFDRPGTYAIVIPGGGRSRTFQIDSKISESSFRTVARALYHQRSGVALEPARTRWSRPASHDTATRGEFLPPGPWYDSTRYAGGAGEPFGFRDASSGEPVAVEAFDLLRGQAPSGPLVEKLGGWFDAADYDRRTQHYSAFWDLAGVYELDPSAFTDGQLSIPESGNGIPDILDEAAVPVRLFESLQEPDGGVPGWVETERHPSHYFPPWRDPLAYRISRPMRTSSAEYAAAAAALSRLLRPFDAARARALLASAIRAYRWARDPSHRLEGWTRTIERRAQGSITVRFTERPESASAELTLAAVQLWLTAGDAAYLADLDAGPAPGAARGWAKVGAWIRSTPDETPLKWAGLVAAAPRLDAAVRADLLHALQQVFAAFASGLEESPYRRLGWPRDHAHAANLAWGAVHPVRPARFAILLFHLTGGRAYLDAVDAAAHWELGTNPYGRSLITGVGQSPPPILQHIASEWCAAGAPIPGVTPFLTTGRVPPEAWAFQLAELAPPGDDAARREVERAYPILRRTFVHPRASPRHNEFTVHESIGPQAAIFAWLSARDADDGSARAHPRILQTDATRGDPLPGAAADRGAGGGPRGR